MEPKSIEELNRYIAAKASESRADEPPFLHNYFTAQILCSQGKYTDALPIYKDAFEEVSKVKSEFVWERMYISIGMVAFQVSISLHDLHKSADDVAGAAYAQVLDYLSMIDKANEIYEELIAAAPNGFFIGDYAVFLHRRKRDFNQAQMFYSKALQLYPFQSSIHLKYAGFLRHVRKEMSSAEHHYKLAVETNPMSSEALGSYASYLHGVKGEIDLAEGFYEKAVEADDMHTNNLCNYGLFLSEERGQYEKAETFYRRALEVSSSHANTLYNFAVMLDTHCKRKEEAESLYRRSLEVEPRHSYALYNLAVLLEEKYSKLDHAAANAAFGSDEEAKAAAAAASAKETHRSEVCKLYQRAVEADPRDATTVADYGRFLLTKMQDHAAAEPVLAAALRIDVNNEVALYNMGILLHKNKMDLLGAIDHFRRLVKLNGRHPAGLVQYARVIIDHHKILSVSLNPAAAASSSSSSAVPAASAQSEGVLPSLDEAFDLFERAILVQKDPSATAIEYLKAATTLGAPQQQLRVIASVDRVMQAKPAGGGVAREKDLRQMLENLRVKSASTTA